MDYKVLDEFLTSYPGMTIKPSNNNELILEGKFSFIAKYTGKVEIEDSYELTILIPRRFPSELPRVFEIGNRIPRDGNHHTHTDGSLCLGSPYRLMEVISRRPMLMGFVEECLVPYLYSMSYKMRLGENFIFGELAHGIEGILNDCLDLFKLETKTQVLETLKLIKMKKRHANKQKCPCGCGNRLGKCNFNTTVKRFREIIPSTWLK